MKKPYRIFVTVLAVALAQISCSKETPSGEELHDLRPAEPRVITVAFGSAVKSRLEDDYTPKFCNGDKILVSNGTIAQELTVSVDDGGKASITTTLDGTLKAVYPSYAAQRSGNEITGVKVPAVQDGTFANANIAMAEDITTNATFKNQTVLFIVTPPDGTEFIRVTSDLGPINTEGADDAGKKQITVSGNDTSDNFYVSILPGVKLSDLSFDTGSQKKEISEADITTAGKSDEALIAGNLYKINNTDWTAYPSPINNTIAAVNAALESGTTAIEINIDPEDTGTTIFLPSAVDGKDVFLNITGVSSKDLSFVYGTGAQGPANLFIATDAQSLVINLPDSHVAVNGGNFQTVTATTSASTLVVGKDVTIGTLDIKGGNADVYGLASNVSRASGVKVNWYADSRAKLLAGLEKSTNGESVILFSDIDLNNEDWDPVDIGKSIVLDGAGHIIRNLKIVNEYDDGHYGLIGHMYSNAVIRNLTIDGAQILPPTSKGGDSRGAALVGILRSGNLENCHVKNVTVSAYQKVGGLVGQLSLEASGTTCVKGCSAVNVVISENMTGEGVWGAGGLIGSLCLEYDNHNVTISSCSVSGISISNSTTEACPQQTAHAFIGTIRGNSNAVVTLSDNTVQQASGLYTDIYSSDYFGWAPNEEYFDSPVNCQIIINGKPWYPDYPFQNKTKGINYLTIAQSSAAASEGDVIHITKGGEYTVETLSLPAGCILEATVEGVVFNHTPTTTSWVANCGDNVTVKKVTWNVGTANHQYFHGVDLVNCKVNGLLCTHSNNTYTDCEFYNADSYNLWEYGSGSTFIRCKFTCPGGTHGVGGGAVNAYNEGQQGMKTVIFEDCRFFALASSDYYSAVYIKPETDFDIRFTGCSADEKFCIGEISKSRLWNVKNNDNTNTKVTVDGAVVYANGELSNP